MMGTEHLNNAEMAELLRWYSSAGVDLCVSDSPVNQFESVEQRPKTLPKNAEAAITTQTQTRIVSPLKAPPHSSQTSPQPPIDSAAGNPKDAQRTAQSANSLDDLRAKLENLQGCALRARATQLVFADGNPQSNIMLVGKAPGRDEDLQGIAFAGPTGQLLDNMLKAIGLNRKKVYLANIVPWRPPGNRDPAPQEIAMCVPFLKRQIELIAPKILITLGEVATKTLLGDQASVLNVRGQWQALKVGDHETQVLATLHPDFLLRQPAQKRQAWLDIQQIAKAVENL